MSSISHHLFLNSSSTIKLHFTSKRLDHSLLSTTALRLAAPTHFCITHRKRPHNLHSLVSTVRSPLYRLQVYKSEGTLRQRDHGNNFHLDSFLLAAEALCLFSSVVVSVGFAVNYAPLGSKKALLMEIGSRVLAWGVVLMAVGVAIGAWIRRRQWRMLFMESVKAEAPEFNLVARVEKLEEDLKNSATIIRVLSRQLEKLGIRFRVTRKTLKEPIAETAALAQKNSEATRALAMQEDILEKELGEIQKVLLAMQEQQQKQLELILAIGKNGKLWEGRQGTTQDQQRTETCSLDGVEQLEIPQNQAVNISQAGNNDRS